MEDTGTHFLKFAYLIEISVVFNLAFLELKLKRDYKNLLQQTKKFAETADGLTDDNICKETGCCNCNDDGSLLAKFNQEDLEYLNNKVKLLQLNKNDSEQQAMLVNAWSYSRSKWARSLSFFHRKVASKGRDRYTTMALLGIVTFILCAITLVDADIFVLHNTYGLSVDVWNTILYVLLVFSIGIPMVFWLLWRKLLPEFECLSILHVSARDAKMAQEMKKNQFEKLRAIINVLDRQKKT